MKYNSDTSKSLNSEPQEVQKSSSNKNNNKYNNNNIISIYPSIKDIKTDKDGTDNDINSYIELIN